MESKYIIYENDRPVGTASVKKLGLYYHLDCRCKLVKDVLWRIGVASRSAQIRLGVCVPEEGEFVIRKQIPIKHIGDEPFQFYILTEQGSQNWIPLCQDAPVSNISQWEKAYFERRNGRPGLRFHSSDTEM